MELERADCLNKLCPKSGEPINDDSLCLWNDHVVGFCNQNCRDEFLANPDAFPKVVAYFKIVLKGKAEQK